MQKPTKRFKLSKKQLIALGASLWMSFLSAGMATILFFATFDPSIIAQYATFPMSINRSAGYSIGFLLFWLLLVLNSLAVIWLVKRKPK